MLMLRLTRPSGKHVPEPVTSTTRPLVSTIFSGAPMTHPSAELARFAAELQISDIPEPVLRRAEDFLLDRSEEHTSELQSLMRISYAVFCLKKKTNTYCVL